MSDNINTIKYYARQYTYLHYEDRGAVAWNAYRISNSVPLNYVVDTAGIVLYGAVGFSESTIRYYIESSLPPVAVSEKTEKVQLINNLMVEPNPAYKQTNIRFSLAKPGHASVRVYSSSGKLVKTLFDGKLTAGTNSFNWNLRDNTGHSVANGIYLYEIITETGSVRTKVSVLR